MNANEQDDAYEKISPGVIAVKWYFIVYSMQLFFTPLRIHKKQQQSDEDNVYQFIRIFYRFPYNTEGMGSSILFLKGNQIFNDEKLLIDGALIIKKYRHF